jgi:rubrerythrin
VADRHWTLNDIPWERFDRSQVNADLLKVVQTAAMVERNGADYGQYLTNVFVGDADFQSAAAVWAAEEEQHGLALARWASLADPAFDADAAFARFTGLYRIPVESTTSVRGSRADELCARCIVETGTSSFYSAMRDATDEPVLKAICARIAADEIRHYKLFFSHLRRYLAREPTSVWRRLKVAFGRIAEADDDELASAWHAGTGAAGRYDRAASAGAYHARALGLYRQTHVARAARLIAKATGFATDGLTARLIGGAMWAVIGFRGRKFRAA